MTSTQLITAISNSDHPELLKAQCISIIREHWKESKKIPLEQLIEYCAKAVSVTIEEMQSKRKTGELVRARQLYAHYGTRWYQVSEMGRFVNCDHTTIIHNRDKAAKFLKNKDDVFMFDLENMERVISGQEPNPSLPKNAPIKDVKLYLDKKSDIYYRSLGHIALSFGRHRNLSIKQVRRAFGANRFEMVYVKSDKLNEIDIAS